MRIRKDNDIKVLWTIERSGNPENMETATDVILTLIQGYKTNCDTLETVIQPTSIVGNVLTIEIPKEQNNILGAMRLVLEYTIVDPEMSDGDRKTTVDKLIAVIVESTELADTTGEFAVTSDAAVGFEGRSAFEVWLVENPDKTLQDYFDWLQQPATDIATEVSQAEALRVQAEALRVQAENIRLANTLSIGTVTGGANASATITGTAPNQTLNMVLPKGDKGDTGIGVPIGGTTGQQLMKKSNVDYDFEWKTPAGAGAGAGAGDMLKSEYDKNDNGVVDNAEKVGGFTVETNVPADAKFTDTVYTHPETHPASIITETTTKRFVTDVEKADWTSKETTEGAQEKATTALTSAKAYVDGKVLTDVPLNAKFTDTIVDISNKVDKETGKGLISTAEVTRLSTVTNQVVPTKLSELSNDQGFITGETIEDLGGGDMLKSTYDTNAKPGYVDKAIDSDTVNGKTVGVNVPSNALFTDTIVDISGKADKSQVLTNVPANAKFTDTVYTHPETHPASIILQNSSNRFVSDAEKLAWNDKVDNSRVLTDVPANAKFTDTIYTHPTSHPYSMITGAPTSLPANGGDSATVNGKTVEENVPAGAKFTDTVYTHPTGTNPHGTTKGDVGLGNVNNTSDADKPVSTATQTALNAKIDASKFQVVAELPASPVTGVFYFIKE